MNLRTFFGVLFLFALTACDDNLPADSPFGLELQLVPMGCAPQPINDNTEGLALFFTEIRRAQAAGEEVLTFSLFNVFGGTCLSLEGGFDVFTDDVGLARLSLYFDDAGGTGCELAAAECGGLDRTRVDVKLIGNTSGLGERWTGLSRSLDAFEGANIVFTDTKILPGSHFSQTVPVIYAASASSVGSDGLSLSLDLEYPDGSDCFDLNATFVVSENSTMWFIPLATRQNALDCPGPLRKTEVLANFPDGRTYGGKIHVLRRDPETKALGWLEL